MTGSSAHEPGRTKNWFQVMMYNLCKSAWGSDRFCVLRSKCRRIFALKSASSVSNLCFWFGALVPDQKNKQASKPQSLKNENCFTSFRWLYCLEASSAVVKWFCFFPEKQFLISASSLGRIFIYKCQVTKVT